MRSSFPCSDNDERWHIDPSTGRIFLHAPCQNVIRVYDKAGNHVKEIYQPQISLPIRAIHISESKIFIADQHTFKVGVYDSDFNLVKWVDLEGETVQHIAYRKGLIITTTTPNNNIVLFNLDGKKINKYNCFSQGCGNIVAMCVNSKDQIILADRVGNKIHILELNGKRVSSLSLTQFHELSDVCTDRDDNIIAIDRKGGISGMIHFLTKDGVPIQSLDCRWWRYNRDLRPTYICITDFSIVVSTGTVTYMLSN